MSEVKKCYPPTHDIHVTKSTYDSITVEWGYENFMSGEWEYDGPRPDEFRLRWRVNGKSGYWQQLLPPYRNGYRVLELTPGMELEFEVEARYGDEWKHKSVCEGKTMSRVEFIEE